MYYLYIQILLYILYELIYIYISTYLYEFIYLPIYIYICILYIFMDLFCDLVLKTVFQQNHPVQLPLFESATLQLKGGNGWEMVGILDILYHIFIVWLAVAITDTIVKVDGRFPTTPKRWVSL